MLRYCQKHNRDSYEDISGVRLVAFRTYHNSVVLDFLVALLLVLIS